MSEAKYFIKMPVFFLGKLKNCPFGGFKQYSLGVDNQSIKKIYI